MRDRIYELFGVRLSENDEIRELKDDVFIVNEKKNYDTTIEGSKILIRDSITIKAKIVNDGSPMIIDKCTIQYSDIINTSITECNIKDSKIHRSIIEGIEEIIWTKITESEIKGNSVFKTITTNEIINSIVHFETNCDGIINSKIFAPVQLCPYSFSRKLYNVLITKPLRNVNIVTNKIGITYIGIMHNLLRGGILDENSGKEQ